MKVEPGNTLKLFLNFSNFEPQYSYRLYSYKKRVYLIDLNFLKTMLTDHGMYCEMQLLSLLDFSFTVSLFLVILNLFFKLLEKYLKIIHKTCWHIYTRPPIGFTPSECLISCKMCSDKISLKLGMVSTRKI